MPYSSGEGKQYSSGGGTQSDLNFWIVVGCVCILVFVIVCVVSTIDTGVSDVNTGWRMYIISKRAWAQIEQLPDGDRRELLDRIETGHPSGKMDKIGELLNKLQREDPNWVKFF